MERECNALDAECANKTGELRIGGLVRKAVREYLDGTRTQRFYTWKKFDCQELDPGWRFTYNHHAERKNNEPHCIYGIADPRDHIIRYVGWTQVSLAQRLARHIKDPVGQYMAKWLGGITSAGLYPEIVALAWCLNHERTERIWIARMRAIGTLLNVTDGGKGNRYRCMGSRLKTLAGPVKVFSKEEIEKLNQERANQKA